jgi:hypothetical protein
MAIGIKRSDLAMRQWRGRNCRIVEATVKCADGTTSCGEGKKQRNLQQSDYNSVTSPCKYFAILFAAFIASVNTGTLVKRLL